MEGEEGTQQPQLVLAHKLFLLRHGDVEDIEKVRLKDEVFTFVKENDMLPLYETLVADSVLDMDQSVIDSMRVKIDEELKKLDEKNSCCFKCVVPIYVKVKSDMNISHAVASIAGASSILP
ncbi:hypothetical protein K1719_005351 [Acacia pycnantha]|nr:hypothetical protein K1719_005351 [Acacia pycnantha]